MEISQSVLITIGVVLLSIIAILVLAKVSASSSLDVINPPLTVARDAPLYSGTEDEKNVSNDSASDIVFETEDVDNIPLGSPQDARARAVITSLGDSRTTEPSSIYWGGGVFELRIWFFIHNRSSEPIKLKDIKAHVYHISMYRLPPATIVYAPRVEMAMDNSADLRTLPNSILPGESQPVQLVLETSIFDTLFTTLVFGLVVFYSKEKGDNSLYKLLSDRIYIFQHDHNWGIKKAHFVARNEEEIDEIQVQTKGYKDFFDSLRRILKTHLAQESL